MKKKIRIISMALCLLITASYAQKTAVIKGTVTNYFNGQPTKITLTLQQDSTTVQTIASDKNGHYAFEGLTAGSYAIQIGNYSIDKRKSKVIWIPEIVLCAGEEKTIDLICFDTGAEPDNSPPMPTPAATEKTKEGKRDRKDEKAESFDVVIEYVEPSYKPDLIVRSAPYERSDKSYIEEGLAKMEDVMYLDHSSNQPAPKARLLTSGEVNDFAKWNQWDTILNKHFKSYLQEWNFKPMQRYMVQIVNNQDIPVINAAVTLKDKCGLTHWTAQTDNTGKAELWLHSFSPDNSSADCYIEWKYMGKTGQIASAVEFSQGINHIVIPAECATLNEADLFFILDATGSMSDEMRYLQAELQDIVGRINKAQKKLNLRIGSLVYRDEGDEYITRKQSLDSDLKKTINFLNKQQAGGGGDYPEAVDEALYQTIANEAWNANAVARIVFIILDAPAHTEKSLRMAQQMKLAAEKGIRVVPIACSDIQKDGEYLMRCLALATNGTYLFLTDDSGIGNSHIKPTTDKYEVEKLNDAIARVVKQYTKIPDCRSQKWVEEDTAFTEADKFVPNPYDEQPTLSDSIKVEVRDLIKVYPNPCQTVLHVEVKQPVQDLWLVDMSGKALKAYHTQNSGIIEIDMQNLAVGIYFVKVFYKGKWYSEKVVKVH